MYKDMPEATFKQFQHVCQAKNLDPVQKEIYAIPRNGKWSFEASIHGLLKVCAAQLDGVETVWYDNASTPVEVWLPDHPPSACKATIYRKGCSHHFDAVVRFDDFGKGQRGGPWRNMPSIMIRKVALTHALRLGFADLIGGLYEGAEMDQIDDQGSAPSRSSVPAPIPNPESSHFKQHPEKLPVKAIQKVVVTPEKPATYPTPRAVAPDVPAPHVDPAAIAKAVAPINESVKAMLMPKMGQLSPEQQSQVVFEYKEKVGLPPEAKIGPDSVKTQQHGQILIDLLNPLVDLSDVLQEVAIA